MKKYTFLYIALFAFIFAGCSGGETETSEQKSETSEQPAASQNTNSDTRTIEIFGIDMLKFVVAEQSEGLQTGNEYTVNGKTYYELTGITAEAGEEVTITLQTISNLPPTAMSHNWLLLTMDADAKAFNSASIKAKDNDYVSPDKEDQVIIDTGLVGDGESKPITFNAPEQTGEYDYICTFPGHFTAGMRGTLTVE